MTAASEWVNGLQETIRNFSRSRGSSIVTVHLSTENFNVQRATPGPGDFFVTLDAYPDVEPGEAVLAAMVQDSEGGYHTARVVLVSLHDIRKVELMHGPPERAVTLGFRAPDEPPR